MTHCYRSMAVYAMLFPLLMTLETEILSTETPDSLKQVIFVKSFNSVFFVSTVSGTCIKQFARAILENFCSYKKKKKS